MQVQASVNYRDIPGWPGYRVGDDGSVWLCWKNGWQHKRTLSDVWRPMKLAVNGKGYLSVNLVPPEGGRYKTFRVHRLVLEAFVGPCPDGMECRHLNGVRADARLVNLAWGTRDENVDDRRKHTNYAPNVRLFAHNGKSLPLKQWAEVLGIKYTCLWHRVSKLGMTFEEAIARPYLGTASNGPHWTKLKRSKELSPSG